MINYIIIAIIVLVIVYVGLTYNKLVHLRNNVKEAFSTMDVYLKKRWDLIPNIVEAVKGYAKHESKTLEEIINLRNSNYEDMKYNEKINVNDKLRPSINKLIGLAENYPELKANENFLDLNKQLSEIENDIANSRKYYNGTIRLLNNKVEMFPSNLIAKIFGFKSLSMFEAEEDERNNVQIKI